MCGHLLLQRTGVRSAQTWPPGVVGPVSGAMTRPQKALVALIVSLLTIAGGHRALAQGPVDPYRSYTIDSTGRPIPIPDPYVLDHTIDGLTLGIGEFTLPSDILIDRANDHLFIVDTRNDRIIELDDQQKVVRQLGPELGLDGPQGIYLDSRDDTLWIADTGNDRIIQITRAGQRLQEFGLPQSDVLTEIRSAAPSKVLVDKRGYIYYLEGTGAGMIVMDQQNQFRGFFGINQVGFSLRWLWARYLSTEEQREKILLAKPTSHSDMILGDDGFIYSAVAGQMQRQLQKLSPVGINLFVEKSLEQQLYQRKIFGERRRSWEPAARFVSVTVDAGGTVTAVDASRARIYQYDQDRNVLLAFGRPGVGPEEFGVASEVDVDSRGLLYVLDTGRSRVAVFRPTPFARLVHQASELQGDGRYAEAAAVWRQVLGLASGYELAHSGLGKAAYHQERWREAMREYSLARNQLGYSLALLEYRQEVLRRSMGWLVGAMFALLLSILAWPTLSRFSRSARWAFGRIATSTTPSTDRPAARLPERSPAHLALGVLVRPIETFEALRSGRSLWPAVLMVGLAAVARVASLAVMPFHMRATPVVGSIFDWARLYRPVAASLLPELHWEEANISVEMLRIILPWLLWTLANYGVSALFDGEGTLRGVVRTTAYCLAPYIVFAVPISLVGYVLTARERGLYESLWSVVFYWVLILLVMQLSTVHNYSGGRTVRVGVLAVFGMAVLGGFIGLVVLLGRAVASVAWEIGYEILRIVL